MQTVFRDFQHRYACYRGNTASVICLRTTGEKVTGYDSMVSVGGWCAAVCELFTVSCVLVLRLDQFSFLTLEIVSSNLNPDITMREYFRGYFCLFLRDSFISRVPAATREYVFSTKCENHVRFQTWIVV